MPMRRRSVASESLLKVEVSWLKTVSRPRVGRSERNNSRSSDVLPAPEGPVRNWNDCGSISKLRSRSTSGPSPYRNPAFSNRTTLSPFRVRPNDSFRHRIADPL